MDEVKEKAGIASYQEVKDMAHEREVTYYIHKSLIKF